MQRMRESQQNQNLARPGMMNPNQFAMRANMAARNGMMNGTMPNANKMSVAQLRSFDDTY